MKKFTKSVCSLALASLILLPGITMAAEGSFRGRLKNKYPNGVIRDNTPIEEWQIYFESLRTKFFNWLGELKG